LSTSSVPCSIGNPSTSTIYESFAVGRSGKVRNSCLDD
jgi:hypothetical protein